MIGREIFYFIFEKSINYRLYTNYSIVLSIKISISKTLFKTQFFSKYNGYINKYKFD